MTPLTSHTSKNRLTGSLCTEQSIYQSRGWEFDDYDRQIMHLIRSSEISWNDDTYLNHLATILTHDNEEKPAISAISEWMHRSGEGPNGTSTVVP